MKLAPVNFTPGGLSVYNGRAAYGWDAGEVDRYTTWLVAVRKFVLPNPAGTPFDATNTSTACPMELYLPPYTKYVKVELLVTGLGDVTLTLATDTFSVKVPVDAWDGAQHKLANAQVVSCGPPKAPADVAGNGENRCLHVGLASSPTTTKLTLKVADHGTDTLKVWAVRCVALAALQGDTLPA